MSEESRLGREQIEVSFALKQLVRPERDWIRVPAEHLRIVPQTLWDAAHARIADSRYYYVEATHGLRNGHTRGVESKYLVPGLARCGCCNGGLHLRFLPRVDLRAVERQARQVMIDWRGLLERNVQKARRVLREVLLTPIVFTPFEELNGIIAANNAPQFPSGTPSSHHEKRRSFDSDPDCRRFGTPGGHAPNDQVYRPLEAKAH